MNNERYFAMFDFILHKRIIPLIAERVDILFESDKYFTHYYKDEFDCGEFITRPILDLTEFALPILATIVYEVDTKEFIDRFHSDILQINPINFFGWLKEYMMEEYILVKAMNKDGIIMTFWATINLDYPAIVREGYEYIFGDK